VCTFLSNGNIVPAMTCCGHYQAFAELFAALDRCEDILSKQRYIAGNELTEADVRLFVTLVRFDQVLFKALQEIHQRI
jgi:putative glutathione S-transferase